MEDGKRPAATTENDEVEVVHAPEETEIVLSRPLVMPLQQCNTSGTSDNPQLFEARRPLRPRLIHIPVQHPLTSEWPVANYGHADVAALLDRRLIA